MKKKILHLSHTDIRSDSRILKELNAISRLPDVEVRAVGIDNSSAFLPIGGIDGVRIDAIRIFSKRLNWLPRVIVYSFNSFEIYLRYILLCYNYRADVIHCHDTLVLPVGIILKRIHGGSLVYDAHELESRKNGQNRLLSLATLAIERISWNSIDSLVTVSEKIIEWYNVNLGKKPSTLILNSPQIDSLDNNFNVSKEKDGSYLRDTFNIPQDARIFLYLGIIGKGRGIEIALDAFSRCHPDAHFVMVGYGALVPMVKTSASRFSNIHYHAAVPHDEVVSIARSADVGLCLIENVSLSDYYCLPNKLFEYAFAGLYVLSCDFPEIRRVVDQHGLGSTCELDSKSLVEAIEKICVHGIHRDVRDLSLLAWETQATRLQEAYKELLSR